LYPQKKKKKKKANKVKANCNYVRDFSVRGKEKYLYAQVSSCGVKNDRLVFERLVYLGNLLNINLYDFYKSNYHKVEFVESPIDNIVGQSFELHLLSQLTP
jgi:hypothetical protein